MNLTGKTYRLRSLFHPTVGIVFAMGIWACNQNIGNISNDKWRCNSANAYGCTTESNSGDNSSTGSGSTSGQNQSTPMAPGSWARSVTGVDGDSIFNGTTVAPTGDIYAVGYQTTEDAYTYGAGVSVSGTYSVWNAMIVKYNAAGTALWARAATAGGVATVFSHARADAAGNVYAVGYQNGGTVTYSPGVTAAGNNVSAGNPVIVKYSATGTALWARSATITSGTAIVGTSFSDVILDNSGNVYVVGSQTRNVTADYGNGVSITVPNVHSYHAILIKYNSSGAAQWARTVSAATYSSAFSSIAMDNSGNIYAGGFQMGNATTTYGTGVTATAPNNNWSALLVKYNSAGVAQWAKTVTAGTAESEFRSIAIDTNAGSIYAAGFQTGNGTFGYDTGITATAPYAGGANSVLVKYNLNGQAQWAKTLTAAFDSSTFNGVATNGAGDIYVSGQQTSGNTFSYALGTDATGSTFGSPNAVIVRFGTNGMASWAKSITSSSSESRFQSIAMDSSSGVIASGVQAGNLSYYYTLILNAIGGSAGGYNAALVRYF